MSLGCEQVMIALEECHAKGFLWKAAGMCNDAKTQLVDCLRSERVKNQSLNRDGVQDKKARIRQKWKEIDENS
jgi:COX assembly protein 2